MTAVTTTLISILLGGAPTPWPVTLEEPAERKQVDLDHDGVLDELVTTQNGGSGWKEHTLCVRHGATGHVACELSMLTAYALFTGQRRTLVPSTDNRAEALLGPEDCVAPDPNSPAQGAMWPLKTPISRDGPVTPTGPWRPGRPQDQQSVCLTVGAARGLVSGLTWYGTEEGVDALAADGWTVRYNAAWPQWAPGQTHNRTPLRVGSMGALEIYQLGHALAVYDPSKNRHAWLINLAALPPDGFKFDRWESIGAITSRSPTTLAVGVGGSPPSDADDGLLILNLQALLTDATP